MPKNPNLVGTLYKAPAETFDVSVDFSAWLTTGDTITSGTVTCYRDTTDNTTAMIAGATDDNDDEITFQVKAGTAGYQYLITVTATTTETDVWVAELNLIVT